MRILIGQYERTIDDKNRLQLPAQVRSALDSDADGRGFYVTLGEYKGTLSLFPERTFEQLASRVETEFMPGADSRKFELQFYGLASHVDVDKQGRILIPERLRKKARLQSDVYLIGQKYRLDIWNRADFDQSLGIDWDGDDWPEDWTRYLRMRPGGSNGRADGAA